MDFIRHCLTRDALHIYFAKFPPASDRRKSTHLGQSATITGGRDGAVLSLGQLRSQVEQCSSTLLKQCSSLLNIQWHEISAGSISFNYNTQLTKMDFSIVSHNCEDGAQLMGVVFASNNEEGTYYTSFVSQLTMRKCY
jgi:hypothetical protein